MVTRRTLEKYMGQVPEIAEETSLKPEEVTRVLEVVRVRIENGRRQPKQNPPEGGIGIREAARKYYIPPSTIRGWITEGKVQVLLITRNWKYISENDLANELKYYKPGRGRRKYNDN